MIFPGKIYLILSSCMAIVQKIAAPNSSYQSGDVVLGGLFRLHQSTESGECGNFFPIGLGYVQAMIFAIDTINNDTALLPNITLGYEIQDYCESPAKAMEHAYDFVRGNEIAGTSERNRNTCAVGENRTGSTHKPITAVIGPTDSTTTVLVGSLLQLAGIPVISPSATSAELSSHQYRHVFRTVPPGGQQAIAMADIIQRFNWSYVAAVALDDSYGRNGVLAMEKETEKRGTFCLSFVEYIPRQDYKAKMQRVISKLKRFPNIKVVVLWLFGGYEQRFWKEAMKQNLEHRTWILSGDPEIFADETYSKFLHGSIAVQPRHLCNNDFINFLIRVACDSTIESSAPWWQEFWEVDAKLSCTKIKALNSNKNMISLAKTLQEVHGTYIPYVIDAVYAVANALHRMNNCSAESKSLLPGGRCPEIRHVVNPKELETYLRKVDFQGLTGRVMFDEFGDPVTSSYDIIHFQCNDATSHLPLKFLIGSWETNREPQLQINTSKIKWNTETGQTGVPKSFCHDECRPGNIQSLTAPCCWECIKCPAGTVSTQVNAPYCSNCPTGQKPNEESTKCIDFPEEVMGWSSLASVMVLVPATIGLILVFVISVIFYNHRETPLVKASNRELSVILLGTISLSFVGAILTLAKPTDLTCGLEHCWTSVVLVTFISVLILKTVKILSAFQINVFAQRFKTFILRVKSQTFLVISMVSVVIVLLILWMILDPPYQIRIIQPEDTVMLACSLHRSSVGLAFQIAICVYMAFLAVVCTYYAFKARKLPENFNEARFIAFSMYILLLSAVGYMLLEIGVKGSHAKVVTCAMTLLSSYGLLTCMFSPKIFVILRQPEQNTPQAVSSQVSEYSFSVFKLKSNQSSLQGLVPSETFTLQIFKLYMSTVYMYSATPMHCLTSSGRHYNLLYGELQDLAFSTKPSTAKPKLPPRFMSNIHH